MTHCASLSDHDLAEAIFDVEGLIDAQIYRRDSLRLEVQRRIEAAGAKQLAVEGFHVELKPGPVTWDVGLLTALKEQLPTWGDLDKVFTAAHETTVIIPDKWNGTQLNAVARRLGGDVAATVARARIPGVPKVVVERT